MEGGTFLKRRCNKDFGGVFFSKPLAKCHTHSKKIQSLISLPNILSYHSSLQIQKVVYIYKQDYVLISILYVFEKLRQKQDTIF